MKCISSAGAFCLVLCCASLACATRLDRSLKQSPSPITTATSSASATCTANSGNCSSTVSISGRAVDDAARSISSALSTAIAEANGNSHVQASANSFALAVANAYARIISSYVVELSASAGSSACASGSTFGQATASAISEATSRAFARSSNQFAEAAADCFSNAVSLAAITATQSSSLQICVTDGDSSISSTLETIGFVQTVATAFSNVFTAIRDNDVVAASTCGAYGGSTRISTTTGSG